MTGKVFTLGEALIDLLPYGNDGGIPLYAQMAGGAPANVAVCLASLGAQAYFVGKAGNDASGRYLEQSMRARGVHTDYFTPCSGHTALAFVSLDQNGDRDFTFYRENCADAMLTPQDVPTARFTPADILHFGTISCIAKPSASATAHAVRKAADCGTLRSCDPNLRLPLWPDPASARETIRAIAATAQLVKLSDEEADFLYGGEEEAAQALLSGDTILLLVTRGADGACAYSAEGPVSVPSPHVATVDTTGAGDAFVGAFLSRVIQAADADVSATDALRCLLREESKISQVLRFSCTCAALATTKKGAFQAMPSIQDVQSLLAGDN